MPTADEVRQVADALGIHLTSEEAVTYLNHLRPQLEMLDGFLNADIEEARPPLLAPEREPGWKPSAAEDPFNAWLWKCDIRSTDTGLLAGKTVSYKDLVPVAGIPLTLGSSLLEGYVADFDATIVTRVLAAGGTVVGKNSLSGPTSGWGSGLPSEGHRPLNPHDVAHWSGGSSSGSAVAVAAREVDISFGGDQAGSIRLPAAFCGVYGLKPTFGLVSSFGVGLGLDQSVDFVGPMARYVEDVAAALDTVAGPDGLDPRQDRTVPEQVDSLGSLTMGVRGLRIGVLDEGFLDAAPEVRDSVLEAVEVLRTAGAQVTSVSAPEHLVTELAYAALEPEGIRAIFDIGYFGAFAKTYYPTSLLMATYGLVRQNTDRLMPRRKLNLIASEFLRRRHQGAVYAKAQNIRGPLRQAFDELFERVDLLVMPTCLQVAPRYLEPDSYLEAALTPRRYSRNLVPFSFTGHPALNVPAGKARGLPVGMQLVGPFYGDALLLRVAYAYQHSVDWEAQIAVDTPTGD